MNAPAAVAALNWETIARASAHETQVLILECLVQVGESTPRELAEGIGLPLGNVSYHVRLLADRGLIDLARTEPRRGALAHFYRLAPGVAA